MVKMDINVTDNGSNVKLYSELYVIRGLIVLQYYGSTQNGLHRKKNVNNNVNSMHS